MSCIYKNTHFFNLIETNDDLGVIYLLKQMTLFRINKRRLIIVAQPLKIEQTLHLVRTSKRQFC